MVILCKNLSSVAQIVSEIWLFKNTEQDRKSRSQGVICNPKKQFLVFFTTFFHFYRLLLMKLFEGPIHEVLYVTGDETRNMQGGTLWDTLY